MVRRHRLFDADDGDKTRNRAQRFDVVTGIGAVKRHHGEIRRAGLQRQKRLLFAAQRLQLSAVDVDEIEFVAVAPPIFDFGVERVLWRARKSGVRHRRGKLAARKQLARHAGLRLQNPLVSARRRGEEVVRGDIAESELLPRERHARAVAAVQPCVLIWLVIAHGVRLLKTPRIARD